MHQDVYTRADASLSLEDLFAQTELRKIRERNTTLDLLDIRVFPLGGFVIFLSSCLVQPCKPEAPATTSRPPLVMQFSSTGTKYGELGGNMFTANYSFTYEDPHNLQILLLDSSTSSPHLNDPLVMSFPQVDFLNMTFFGVASYAPVNWSIENVLPSGVVDRMEEDEEALITNISSTCTEEALYGKFCDWVLDPKVTDLGNVLCLQSDRLSVNTATHQCFAGVTSTGP